MDHRTFTHLVKHSSATPENQTTPKSCFNYSSEDLRKLSHDEAADILADQGVEALNQARQKKEAEEAAATLFEEMLSQARASRGNLGEKSSVIPDSWRQSKNPEQPIDLSQIRYLSPKTE